MWIKFYILYLSRSLPLSAIHHSRMSIMCLYLFTISPYLNFFLCSYYYVYSLLLSSLYILFKSYISHVDILFLRSYFSMYSLLRISSQCIDLNSTFLNLITSSPLAKHPRGQHLSQRPIRVGYGRARKLPRRFCNTPLLWVGPRGGVCDCHRLLCPWTTLLAPAHLCLQVGWLQGHLLGYGGWWDRMRCHEGLLL